MSNGSTHNNNNNEYKIRDVSNTLRYHITLDLNPIVQVNTHHCSRLRIHTTLTHNATTQYYTQKQYIEQTTNKDVYMQLPPIVHFVPPTS